MTGAGPRLFLLWLSSRPRWQRLAVQLSLGTHLTAIAMCLFAPKAFANGLDGLLGFTGITDSYGVPLTANRFVMADDSLIDWNGVLPRVNPGNSVSAGVINAFGAAETSLIVVTVALALWLIRALRSTLWNDLFGSVFTALGNGIEAVVNAGPFLGIGIIIGSLVGIVLIAFGRGTAGRFTIAVTWLLGIFGLAFGRELLAKMLSPSGWMNTVREMSSGIAGTLITQGRNLTAGDTGVDRQVDALSTAFADAVRETLQVWMLGRVVDPRSADASGGSGPGSMQACSQAWTSGQRSGNSQTLAQAIIDNCPAEVVSYIGSAGLFEGIGLWLLLMACVAVGAWFAWCALMCLFRALFYAGFAVVFILYGLIPGFPRRFLKLTVSDFVTQIVSYGVYVVLTAVYVVVLMTTWNYPALRVAGLGGDYTVVARLVVTALMMMLFVKCISHVAKLHGAAMNQPAGPSASNMTSPIKSAVAGGAALGLAGAAASRGGAGPFGGSSGAAKRMNAGMRSAAMMLSRTHPAAAAAGAVVGGLGSAASTAMRNRGDGGSASSSGSSGSPGSGSATGGGSGGGGPTGGGTPRGGGQPGGGGGRGPAGPSGGAASQRQGAQQRAQQVRQSAAAMARQQAMRRPGAGGGPVGGQGGSGFTTR